MTLTIEYDLDSVELNQHVKYLGQRSFILTLFMPRSSSTVKVIGQSSRSQDETFWYVDLKMKVKL